MIRFHWLTGDRDWLAYDGKWISNRQNNGEFDYWLILSLDNLEDNSEFKEKYLVGLYVVAPSQIPDREWQSVLDCCGWEGADPTDDETRCEIAQSYGHAANLGEWLGNNAYKLLKNAKREAQIQGGIFFGFAMDRYQNRIGSTGWDLIRGDILAGLHREDDSSDSQA